MHLISSKASVEVARRRCGDSPSEATDVGETLLETLLTIVIVGLTVTALLSSLATVGNAGNAQRNAVLLDTVMRNYAEATKAAARGCVPGATYTVVYPSALPPGFGLSVAGTGVGTGAGVGSRCPDVLAPQLLTLTVVGLRGTQATMQIKVSSR